MVEKKNINKEEPIIGQEAICPDGLGRVVNFDTDYFGVANIKVETYVDDRSCNWAAHNVKLIEVRK